MEKASDPTNEDMFLETHIGDRDQARDSRERAHNPLESHPFHVSPPLLHIRIRINIHNLIHVRIWIHRRENFSQDEAIVAEYSLRPLRESLPLREDLSIMRVSEADGFLLIAHDISLAGYGGNSI